MSALGLPLLSQIIGVENIGSPVALRRIEIEKYREMQNVESMLEKYVEENNVRPKDCIITACENPVTLITEYEIKHKALVE